MTKIDDLKTTCPCRSHIQRLHYSAFASFFIIQTHDMQLFSDIRLNRVCSIWGLRMIEVLINFLGFFACFQFMPSSTASLTSTATWVDISIILQISDHSTTHPTAKVVELKLLLQLQFLTLTTTSPLFSNLTWAWPILVPACSYCFLFGLVFWHMHKKKLGTSFLFTWLGLHHLTISTGGWVGGRVAWLKLELKLSWVELRLSLAICSSCHSWRNKSILGNYCQTDVYLLWIPPCFAHISVWLVFKKIF